MEQKQDVESVTIDFKENQENAYNAIIEQYSSEQGFSELMSKIKAMDIYSKKRYEEVLELVKENKPLKEESYFVIDKEGKEFTAFTEAAGIIAALGNENKLPVDKEEIENINTLFDDIDTRLGCMQLLYNGLRELSQETTVNVTAQINNLLTSGITSYYAQAADNTLKTINLFRRNGVFTEEKYKKLTDNFEDITKFVNDVYTYLDLPYRETITGTYKAAKQTLDIYKEYLQAKK